MPITNTDEFLAYSSFNSSGVTTSDTFNTWRKKTNGIINAIDNISVTNVGPGQLSLGAPTWTSAGALQTYNSGSFTAGVVNGTTINASIGINGGSITGTGLKVGSGGSSAAAGAIHATALAIGSANTQFTVSSTGAVIGASLKIGGSSAVAIGGINSLSLAVGTNNTQFTVSNEGVIVGASLNVGTGAISCGAISGASLNVGTGAISCGAISAASFNGPLNGNATSATTAATAITAATASTVSNASITAAKLDGGQSGPAPVYGVRAYAYVLGGNSPSFASNSNKGFDSVTRSANGRYTLTLSQTPTATPAIVATAVSSGSNVSAAAYNISGRTFSIRTGFEDGENTATNADFSVMVIY
jgi:hypothetical protein